MDSLRIYYAFAVPVVSYVLKWFFYTFARGVKGTLFGLPCPPFESAKHFRFLGWDMAAASMGLYLAALTTDRSVFWQFQNQTGKLFNLFTVVTLIVYLCIYGAAAICRYYLQERAEEAKLYRNRIGLLSWGVGLVLLLTTASMAMEK
jgi:hypothetical protein